MITFQSSFPIVKCASGIPGWHWPPRAQAVPHFPGKKHPDLRTDLRSPPAADGRPAETTLHWSPGGPLRRESVDGTRGVEKNEDG